MSDEDLRDVGFNSNALGQLRSIVKSQTSNGINQNSGENRKGESGSTGAQTEQVEVNEVLIIFSSNNKRNLVI